MIGLGNIGKYMVSRYFWLIHEPKIENLQYYCTLIGSIEMHSFQSLKATSLVIQTRYLT